MAMAMAMSIEAMMEKEMAAMSSYRSDDYFVSLWEYWL
jgi:hypothetical protein